jgi:ketosteroid isomerase-like protein
MLGRVALRWILVLAVIACGPTADPDAAREVLLETDRQSARSTADRPVEAWVSFYADDGVMFRLGGTLTGHEAIRQLMAPAFANTSFSRSWEPTHADVAGGGGFGVHLWALSSQLPRAQR